MLSGGLYAKTACVALVIICAGWFPSEVADLEMQVIDKNCWIEIFEDDDFDADDPHVKLYGPKEFATLKSVAGKDWSNDIESVIVGCFTSAVERAEYASCGDDAKRLESDRRRSPFSSSTCSCCR